MSQELLPTPPPHLHRKQRPAGVFASLRRVVTSAFAWLLVLFVVGTLAGIVGLLAVVLGERDYSGRIYPHISVRGTDIGTLPVATARATLEQHHAAFLEQPITLTFSDTVWQPTAAELGASLDFDAAIQQAQALGRGDTRVDNVRTVSAAWEAGIDLPLHLQIDQRVLQHYLRTIAQTVDHSPANADVRLADAQIVVTNEQFGRQVLVDETLSDVTAALQSLERQQVPLRTRTLEPQLHDSDVAPLVAELTTLLGAPVTLASLTSRCGAACRWVWSPEQIAQWLTLQRASAADGRPQITLHLDQAAIRNALLPLAAALREEGTLPRVGWNNGALSILQPGDSGRGLDASLALARVDAALRSDQRAINLPLMAIPPPFTEANLASLGITSEIGVGISSFRASAAYRITNIEAGAARMHGLLVPPDAAFSFNDNLGVVDGEHGFVEGLAIIDNRTQKEWGGGLCQVSTTMFRAAFWGGLPITERHEHAFRIRWYEELGEPPGLDAAIYTGYNDLRFVNDTGNWLLIQSYVDTAQQRLVIALYGAPSTRQVSMASRVLEETPAPTKPTYIDDPTLPAGTLQRTDIAQGGMRLDVYRVVRVGNQVLHDDVFPTTFKPWPEIYVRGTRR